MDTAHEMFARMFRRYRNAAGTVSEAARLTGYDHSYISQIEAGKKMPSLDAAEVFDQAFGTEKRPEAAEYRELLAASS